MDATFNAKVGLMQFWRRTPDENEQVSRTEMILARKPDRTGAGPRPTGLLQVIIPREQPRRNHERGEDRRIVEGVQAHIVVGDLLRPAPLLNLSSGGVMLETDLPLRIGREMMIALDGCDPIPMIVRWVRGTRVGLEFLAETTVVADSGVQQHLVAAIHRDASANSLQPAPFVGAESREGGARHALIWLCELSCGEGVAVTRLRNISKTGAMISFDGDAVMPTVGETVNLAMGEDSSFEAQIAWCCEGLAGLRFTEPFDLDELIHQPCVEVIDEPVAAHSAPQYASREEAMRIAYTGMKNPYDAPDMEYKPLTLRELYTTLYSGDS